MMSFRKNRIAAERLPVSAAWLLGEIAESKGKQELFTRQSPQILKALRDIAILESAESSNRIEGVTVAADRLRPLVGGRARPRDRSESEIVGYRRALTQIHTRAARLSADVPLMKQMHAFVMQDSGDAGQFKRVDNEIIEHHVEGHTTVRFRAVPAGKQTEAAVEELVTLHRDAQRQSTTPGLVNTAAFILDFLCIHPFHDGNGRVARLLTLLLLYHEGIEAGRYISLEKLVEESKEDYYAALHASSQDWHQGRHDLLPWLNYFLGIVRRAYAEFENRVGELRNRRGEKTASVLAAVNSMVGQFTISELERACPTVGRDMIRKVMNRLRDQGQIECLGRGRGAAWQKCGNNIK